MPIESRMVTKSIERAQKQVEGHNFEIRKHLLEYDDVMNKQREAVYRLRRNILDGKEGREWVLRAAREIVGSAVDTHCPEDKDPERLGPRRSRARAQGRLRSLDPGHADVVLGRGHPPEARGGPRRRRRGPPTRSARRPSAPSSSSSLERYILLSVLDAQLEGPPARPRPPQGGHRPARLRPARPAGRVQAGVVRPLPGDDGPHRGPGRPVPVTGSNWSPTCRQRRRQVVAREVKAEAGGLERRAQRRPSSPRPPARPPPCAARPPRSAATTPAPAAPARSTRSATAPRRGWAAEPIRPSRRASLRNASRSPGAQDASPAPPAAGAGSPGRGTPAAA